MADLDKTILLKQEDRLIPIASTEVLTKILDRGHIPQMFKHFLLGYSLLQNENGQYTFQKTGQEIMNKEGAEFFTTFLNSATSVDKLATYISDEELKRMCRSMMRNIAKIIAKRYREFDISPDNWDFVLDLFDHFYFTNLTSSREGTYLDVVKPTVKHIETIGTKKPDKIPEYEFGGK